jgi:hypothetical protein
MLPLGQSYLEWPGRGKGEVRPVKAAFSGSRLGKQENGPGSAPVCQGAKNGLQKSSNPDPREYANFREMTYT